MDLFIATMGENATIKASALAMKLRKNGIYVETDICQRSIKANLKYADKKNAKFSLVLGDEEIQNGKAKLKNMANGEEIEVSLDEEEIRDIIK